MVVNLITITPEAEKLIAQMARVSNPSNQDNPNYKKLISYCIKHKHWSILEMANMVVEIETSRAISAQILRHRSFTFQEFSQRYAQVPKVVWHKARRQDKKNRQNSVDDLSPTVCKYFAQLQSDVFNTCTEAYEEALSNGIAKEQARMLLPMASATRIYMNGTLRSWVHYINLRTGPETQLEHREIALSVKAVFCSQLPIVASALGWVAK